MTGIAMTSLRSRRIVSSARQRCMCLSTSLRSRRLWVWTPELLFGRLYYFLEEKYGTTGPDGARKTFSRSVLGETGIV